MGCRSSKAVAPAPLDSPVPETPQGEAEARALKTDVSRFTSAVFRDQATEALESILAAPPQIKNHFRAYLASERNESTLDFLDEVQRWHRLVGDEAADAAVRIYERYVRPGGEEELNLPSSLRRCNMFNDPEQHASLLERALHEVISLLALDAWPRFLRSKHCQAMLDQLMTSPETTWTPGVGGMQSKSTERDRGLDLSHAGTTTSTAQPAAATAAAVAEAPAVGGNPAARTLPDEAASQKHPGSDFSTAAVSSSLNTPAVPSAATAKHDSGASSPGSRPYGTSLELSAALHAARSQLRMARGQWLQLFESVAEFIPSCIVIADMRLPGTPLVFVNQAFCHVTGYTKAECIGRNCNFLQGPLTEPASVQRIRSALRTGCPLNESLINYRKDGTPFRNFLSLAPVFVSRRSKSHHGSARTAAAQDAGAATDATSASAVSHATEAALPTLTDATAARADVDAAASSSRDPIEARPLAYFIGLQFALPLTESASTSVDSALASRLLRNEALLRMLPTEVTM